MAQTIVEEDTKYYLDDGSEITREEWLIWHGLPRIPLIDSKEKYETYLRRRANKVNEVETVQAQLKALLARLESELRSMDYLFFGQAEQWTKKEVELTGKRSVITPWGTAKFTGIKAGWKMDDEGELQRWLAALPEAEKLQYKVAPKSFSRDLDLIKSAAVCGVVVPGLRFEEAHEKFSIAYAKGG